MGLTGSYIGLPFLRYSGGTAIGCLYDFALGIMKIEEAKYRDTLNVEASLLSHQDKQ
jgi:hypothetical protein